MRKSCSVYGQNLLFCSFSRSVQWPFCWSNNISELLRKLCFEVNCESQADQSTLVIHLPSMILFGFGAIILDLFEIPGSIECRHVLHHNHSLKESNSSLSEAWDQVDLNYRLTVAYAYIKGTYIAFQVWDILDMYMYVNLVCTETSHPLPSIADSFSTNRVLLPG